jgi:hypothetical protein
MLEPSFCKGVLKAKELECKLPDFKNVRSLAMTGPWMNTHEKAFTGFLLFPCLVSVKAGFFKFTRFPGACPCCCSGSMDYEYEAARRKLEELIIRRMVLFVSRVDPNFQLPKIEHPH